jgi:hypothetical protein
MATPGDIAAAIRRLSRKRLLVGIPQERDPRRGEPIGNASLGYIHEFGSPARNIPARPFLVPGVESALPEIQQYLGEAARAALAGEEGGIDAGLTKAGLAAVNAVRLRIQAGIPPPLQPATVARRRQRTAGSRYRRQAETAADVTPLIDTGQLLASITYVLREE